MQNGYSGSIFYWDGIWCDSIGYLGAGRGGQGQKGQKMKIVMIVILFLIPVLDIVITKADQLFDMEEDIDEE